MGAEKLGDLSREMDTTFGDHDLLQAVALHQKFFIPFLSAEIVLFLDVDDSSVDARDSLSDIFR